MHNSYISVCVCVCVCVCELIVFQWVQLVASNTRVVINSVILMHALVPCIAKFNSEHDCG